MITGYLEEDKPWMDDINDPVDDQYDIILGFNEPNRPDHSDIPPEVAASAWIELQNLYPTKVGQFVAQFLAFFLFSQTLVSPAPASGNTHWFDPSFQVNFF